MYRRPRAFRLSWIYALVVSLVLAAAAAAQPGDRRGRRESPRDEEMPEGPLPSIAEKTAGFEKREGFLTFYVDPLHGKVWLELPPPAPERGLTAQAIYYTGLVQGLGSNPVGLDRGLTRNTHLLDIRRVGPRVLFEATNVDYRALSDDPAERRAVRDSFGTSVLWGRHVEALDDDGRALVDLTSFLLRDAMDVAETLKATGQGEYEIDPSRSAPELDACLAFPDNVELESLLTWGGRDPGDQVRRTAPAGHSVTLRLHQSLVRLPDDGYRPRRADPRIGSLFLRFADYAVALEEAVARSWVLRHRLEKTDPSAARSTVVEPIVYYVDPGAPEPIRSALVEGASWWTEAFEAAGFVDAYRVELLPEDVHPLDVRYNVVQWVHRATRGWSFGSAITDPRTGEILKGHVILGSLRVRQDRLLFEGLLGTEKTGSGEADDPVELALERIRQLAAHEVGHTLGFTHNFAASTYDGRASVMDYPAPLVDVTEAGGLDVSRVYDRGIGSWDVECVRYAYSQFPPGADEEAELQERIRSVLDRGFLFLSDADARPPGAADPRGNLWDNGTDAVAELRKVLRVREIALARFGEENVREGRPLAELEEVLAPLYFHHRYQLDAAAKVLGGMEIQYAVRGDGQRPTRILSAERQREALTALLSVLEPEVLDLPETVLEAVAPRAYGVSPNRELFTSGTSPGFDALGAAATAADAVVAAILQPERLARLQEQNRRDAELPGVGEVLEALLAESFGAVPAGEPSRYAALRREVQRVVVDRMTSTASVADLKPTLRAELEWSLGSLHGRLAERAEAGGPEDRAHVAALTADLERFLGRESHAFGEVVHPAPPPPGSPIGMPGLGGCSYGGGEGR